jgi:hypothetical protein
VNKVRSSDGTDIAFDRLGDGPPVILVCGASTDRTANAPLAALQVARPAASERREYAEVRVDDPPRDRLELFAFHHRLLPTRRPGTCRLPSDAVVQMGDTSLRLEDPGALQLDVPRIALVEETAPLAEEHRDEMGLEFVEDAGGERESRGCGAVDQHVLLVRSPLGLGHRGRYVGHISDQRPSPHFAVGFTAADDEDGTPSWWSPPQPPAGSKVRRPVTTAPVAISSSKTWPFTPEGRPGTPDGALGSPPDNQ